MSGFKGLLVKTALLKVPSLRPLTEDFCVRARAYAATTEDSDASDEARVQLLLAAHELIALAKSIRGESMARTRTASAPHTEPK